MFDWVAGTGPDGATPIPPGGGYQLVLVDADSRVGNATSPLFSIFSAQPSVRILSILDGAFFGWCRRHPVVDAFLAVAHVSNLHRHPIHPPTAQDGAMWIRGRDAHIQYRASDANDTITFEIQDAVGSVVHTITSQAPGSEGQLVVPVSYASVSQAGRAVPSVFCFWSTAFVLLNPTQPPVYTQPPPDCFSCFLVAVSNTYPDTFHVVSTRGLVVNTDWGEGRKAYTNVRTPDIILPPRQFPTPFSIGSHEHSDLESEQ